MTGRAGPLYWGMLTALLTLMLTLPAAAEVYDCSSQSEQARFAKALAELKASNKDLHRDARATLVEEGPDHPRRCPIQSWCLIQKAKVKFAPGGGSVKLSVVSAPARAACPEPLYPGCSNLTSCMFDTEPLESGNMLSGAKIVHDGGKTTIAEKAPVFEESSGNAGDFPGMTFVSRKRLFKIQPLTGIVFERDPNGGKLADTGVSLDERLTSLLCREAGEAACKAGAPATCDKIGLKPKKGRKGSFEDARGGVWTNKSSQCVAKERR